MPLKFTIQKKIKGKLGRAGTLVTKNGVIETPSFVVVGTKATVKAVTPEQLLSLGTQVVLANTYHLYLQPGDKLIHEAGGFPKFMNWKGPSMTDSGGFQVFSLGAAFGTSVSKVAKKDVGLAESVDKSGAEKNTNANDLSKEESPLGALAKIDEEGVTFKSFIDGSEHRFTPERSIEIQHNIGADMIFAFDECTSPNASHEYQTEAMARTHRWAARCLEYHKANNTKDQALLGIVQGGRFEDLRKESARQIAAMDFDGFGIGGSFDKEDMYSAVEWVNTILPEEKPRHLLGIGEPSDLFGGIENGIDLFDCVAPTRMARHGSIFTEHGRINILNAKYVKQFSAMDPSCTCYTCTNYTAAYLSHLFRAKEMLAGTLASIHNLHFIVHLVKRIRQSILDDKFYEFKESFLKGYYK